MSDEPSWDELRELGARICGGEAAAWEGFWVGLEPHLEQWIANPSFLGKVSTDEDRRRDLLMLCWEKLQDGDFSKLRAFFSRAPSSDAAPGASKHPFRAWVRRVVKNLGIDYMRTLPEHIRHGRPRRQPVSETLSSSRSRGANEPKHWHSIVSLHSQVGAGDRPPVTIELTARRMLEFLDETIPERQRRAVELFESGSSFEDIAAKLGLKSAADAERALARAQDRMLYRTAIELWTQQLSDAEIAEVLALDDAGHAYRLVNAAKEHLKRTFRE